MLERVLIVDDEPLARERLTTLVSALAPQAMLREAGNGAVAAELITSWRPDVVFLDIQMPELTGFEVVSRIGADRMPPTIFVTAHDEFALRAFEVAAVDYLLKPFDAERFAAAWHRMQSRHATAALVAQAHRLSALVAATERFVDAAPSVHSPVPRRAWADRIVVRHDQRTIVVPLAEVQYIESDGNYVVLHAGPHRHTVRETLRSLESRLDPGRFVRIHRRIIVAMDAMRELQPWFAGDQVMILKDGTKLRVSRSHREALAQHLAGEN